MTCSLFDPDSGSDDDDKEKNLITSFSFLSEDNAELGVDITGEIEDDSITLDVSTAIDYDGLIASFESSGEFVTVGFARQESGVTPNDFSTTVNYKVHGDDGSTRDYHVSINQVDNTENAVESFSFTADDNVALASDVTATIKGTEIRLNVPNSTDMTALVATFTLSDNAQASISGTEQSSGVSANDHSSDIVFTVTSESGASLDYTVMVFEIVTIPQLNAKLMALEDVTRVYLEGVTDFTDLFSGNATFNQDIGDWDVSHVVIMDAMFDFASAFNQDLSDWDVSNVVSMNGTFGFATSFNQDIGDWDVSQLVDMSSLFEGATAFNQDLGNWDVGSATDMGDMFNGATSFNQDIGSWDVSAVTDMSYMFNGAVNFNQDISAWAVDNVTNMAHMFNGAASFDTSISSWSAHILEVPIPADFSSGVCPLVQLDHPYVSWDS